MYFNGEKLGTVRLIAIAVTQRAIILKDEF